METNNKELFPIRIVTKFQEEFVVECRAKTKVKSMKWSIHKQRKIEPKHQRLFFEGIELEEPDYEISCYGIEPEIATNGEWKNTEFKIILSEVYQGIPQTFFLDEAYYDHKWNCSYEKMTNNKILQKRGGKPYYQPIGCIRYGLKVLGKYEDDNWLGGKGYRTEDEWPVAYHGTKELNVLEILRHGFLIEKGVRFAYGKGIYCSPDPRVALGYAYHYEFENKLHKLIIQCRVDPKKLQIHGGNYWLVTEEKHIRPYAICVYSEDNEKLLAKHSQIRDQHGFYWGTQGGGVSMSTSSTSISNANPPPIQFNMPMPPSQIGIPPIMPLYNAGPTNPPQSAAGAGGSTSSSIMDSTQQTQKKAK